MKSKTDNQMWEKKHRIKESQTEVDNGVHPLHWDTSPGHDPEDYSSLIYTDPIWYNSY